MGLRWFAAEGQDTGQEVRTGARSRVRSPFRSVRMCPSL